MVVYDVLFVVVLEVEFFYFNECVGIFGWFGYEENKDYINKKCENFVN